VSANDLDPFLDRDYRDSYLEGYVKTSIALQIRALRERLGITQSEFAKKLDVTQSVVSRLENTEYGAVTISTLLKVARENNVALEVRFVDYPTILSSGFRAQDKPIEDINESFSRASEIERA